MIPATHVEFPPFNKLVNPSFAHLFTNKDRYIFEWGGRNGSRSTSTGRCLLYRCLDHEYFRCIMIRKVHNSIKDSIWQTLKDEAEALGIEDLFTFKVSPLEIVCNNGNKFIARGLDQPAKLKSIKDPTCAWYEEGNQITVEDFITVTTSMRSSKAEFLQEIFTFNPETEGNYEDFWMWKMFFEGHAEKSFRSTIDIEYIVDGEKKMVQSNYTVHHSTYRDNQYLTIQQIADLEQWKVINPYYYTVYTLGEWGNKAIEGKFWSGFNRLKHVKDDIFLDLEKPIHMSFDENNRPYPAMTIWQYDELDAVWQGNKLLRPETVLVRQVHEICLTEPNNKLVKVAKELIRWLTINGWHNLIYEYGDASSDREDTKLEKGVNYFTILRDVFVEAGYSVRIRKPNKNPPVAFSAEFINACFEANYLGFDISISSECKESINDYLLVQAKTDGTMKKPKDKNGIEILGHCFIGETTIKTLNGDKRIKDIKEGEFVLTRFGFRKVLRSWLTRKDAIVKTYNICGNEITCTPDHKIYTKNRGFIAADKLIVRDIFCILKSWNQKKSFTTVISSPEHYGVKKVTQYIMSEDLTCIKEKSICIGTNGLFIMALSQKGITSTILIKILSIMTFLIMSVYRLKNIGKGIRMIIGIIQMQEKSILKRFKNWQKYGIDQKREGNGIDNMELMYSPTENIKNTPAKYVKKPLKAKDQTGLNFVPTIAKVLTGGRWDLITSKETVNIVANNSQLTNIQKPNVVQSLVVPNSGSIADVYDLTIEGDHEFFANNILVHNCSDSFRYFFIEAFKKQFEKYKKRGAGKDRPQVIGQPQKKTY